MTVNLTRIYTRLGDDGETHLGDMSRVPKTHPRIEAYGTVDELNAQLAVALALTDMPERFAGFLRRVQNDLFDVGADISVPHGGDRTRLRLAPEQTTWLEQACDEVNAELAPLRSFVLPGGTPPAAQLHVCRTVCRRAERRTIDCGDEINRECVRYLNRLSDLLAVGANLATPGPEDGGRETDYIPPVPAERVAEMEGWMDEADAELEPLRTFILPGGSEAAARLHLARTVCRRAERRAIALAQVAHLDEQVIVYLNRLSDLLFTLARLANHRAGVADVGWSGGRR